MDLSKIPPGQRAEYLRRVHEVEAVPGPVRAQIAKEVIESQRAIKQVIYHSTVRFRAARTGAGPFTYTISTEPVVAFGYKVGDSLVAAGFASGVANASHTNLKSAGGQTNRNADVVIFGIGIEIVPGSEPLLVGALVRETFLGMSTDGGSNTDLIGKLSDFPSGGALYGAGRTLLRPGPEPDGNGPLISFLANGNPMAGNWYMLKRAIRWNAQASKKPDSNLAITLTPGASIVETATDRAAAAGIVAFTSPADGAEGTHATFRLKLLTVEVSDRSANQ